MYYQEVITQTGHLPAVRCWINNYWLHGLLDTDDGWDGHRTINCQYVGGCPVSSLCVSVCSPPTRSQHTVDGRHIDKIRNCSSVSLLTSVARVAIVHGARWWRGPGAARPPVNINSAQCGAGGQPGQ